MLLNRVSVAEHLVIPVCVAIVNPLLFSVTDIGHNPRTVRILGLVIDAGEKLHHIVLGVSCIWSTGSLGFPECIQCEN